MPCGSASFKPLLDDAVDELPWWLDSRLPHSLTLALLKCLEACPRDALRDAASNLVVYGEDLVVIPDLGRRLALAVKEAIVNDANQLELGDPQSDDLEPLTLTPVCNGMLRPIADHLGVTSIAPYRPDLISWIGTSVWATMHYRHGFDTSNEVQNKWILKPDLSTM